MNLKSRNYFHVAYLYFILSIMFSIAIDCFLTFDISFGDQYTFSTRIHALKVSVLRVKMLLWKQLKVNTSNEVSHTTELKMHIKNLVLKKIRNLKQSTVSTNGILHLRLINYNTTLSVMYNYHISKWTIYLNRNIDNLWIFPISVIRPSVSVNISFVHLGGRWKAIPPVQAL